MAGSGLRHDLELVHREGALAQSRAQAVGPGVPTPDDDHVLACGRQRLRWRHLTFQDLVGVHQVQMCIRDRGTSVASPLFWWPV